MSNFLLKPGPTQESQRSSPSLDLPNPVTATNLSDLNLEDELLIQYKATRSMLQTATLDVDTPLNQKAQILNTGYTILSGIIKLQESLHNIESLKLLETCLIDTLKEFEPIRDSFLVRYEQVLESKSASGFKRTIQEANAKPVIVPPLSTPDVTINKLGEAEAMVSKTVGSNAMQLEAIENLTHNSSQQEIESATDLFLKNFDKE